MRYSDGHKQETRKRVLRAAAAAIRARGPHGLAVAGIMAEAGLTHGGFYAHFANKDALVAAAVEEAFAQGRRRFLRVAEGLAADAAFGAFLDVYLSPQHRDEAARGCPIPALSGDMARAGPAARAAYDSGVARVLDGLSAWVPGPDPAARRALAASLLAEMAGAIALSRAVSDPTLADEILAASRERVRLRAGLPDTPLHTRGPSNDD